MQTKFIYELTRVLAAAALGFMAGYCDGQEDERKRNEADGPAIQTDTVWLKPDTIRVDTPVPVEKWRTRTEYIPVPVTDTVWLHGTDTAYVPVPMETTYYAEKDYEAWVTGYEATLDSLHIFRPVAVVEKKVPVYMAKRWGIGLQAGVTYNTQTKTTPYIGFGVSYNLITF